jgi:hypothetical protein
MTFGKVSISEKQPEEEKPALTYIHEKKTPIQFLLPEQAGLDWRWAEKAGISTSRYACPTESYDWERVMASVGAQRSENRRVFPRILDTRCTGNMTFLA